MADLDRIRSNVQSMIEQGAPEKDIDTYLLSEKVSPAQLRSAAEPVDPIKATVQKEFEEKKALGRVADPTQRRLLQGMTFNAADEILAAGMTPFEMIKRGTFNPIEGYKYAKAKEDVELEDARKNGGIGGTIAEIGGGVVSGAGIGPIIGRGMAAGAGLLRRSLASAADAGILGGLSGLAEGNTLAERGGNAAQGLGLGIGLGGAAPGAVALGQRALAPVTGYARALMNPQGYARSQVARGVVESGQSPDDIALAVTQAANEGQGMFTVADAMGNAGQRMLATTARSPGAARTNVTEFLDQRQAGQGRRIASQLSEGFDAPVTADQTRRAMTAMRDDVANAEYGAVRNNAGNVDLSGVIARIDQTIPTTPLRNAPALADDSIESTLRGFRQRMTDGRSMLTDFQSAMRTRDDLADAAQAAVRAGRGKRAHALGQIVRELDDALEGASAGYRQANRNFRQASQEIEAIDTGRTAALRGRPEDTIPQFNNLSQVGQFGYRAGYADPLIEAAQGSAMGVNKARPLINDAFARESSVMAPGAPMMQRQIGRENTMFQTRNAVTGNSKTVENLNDDAAMGVDIGMIGQVLSGNFGSALRSAMGAMSKGWNGNTAAVREEVARLLMQRGQNVNPRAIQQMLDETMRRIEMVSNTARQIGRGGSGGLAVTPSATGNRR